MKLMDLVRLMITTDNELCVGCGNCVPFCPAEALTVYGLIKVDFDLCIECLTCIDYCPNKALNWEEE